MSIMRHGDFIARITFDAELGKFFGEVANTADVVTFYGSSVEELKREFAASIEAHIEFCRRNGVAPSKPYSGKFNVRMEPEAHAMISAAASAEGQSMNVWIVETLKAAAEKTLAA